MPATILQSSVGFVRHGSPCRSLVRRDPARREAAAGLVPQPVLAHAALLSALARLAPAAAPGELTFAARLAATEPETTADLATLLTRAAGPADPAKGPA
ncbi:hypothetical protein ACIQ6Y_19370 [Streptomyces sp. NPDC096205]|uniref:hypothetical protein n=1 Tax=Streptomyces sp. NPDC096205 TaxID=3366081 RepID=UPI0038304E9E